MAPAEARATLLATLGALPAFDRLRTHFITTLRSDYLGDLFHWQALFDTSKRGMAVRGMSEAELVWMRRVGAAIHKK